ncbi:NUC091 domain-containing protein [Cantharellus anzutake]|uniref:NUC091 domain-containing protein n=1 Tax=Cantharellus anzutake TaxID=1750568 RepID=UPI001908393F|nr:NUC091 domain-containing protein [Cantharellus anzutake]KAF8327933.1 NUC091 domain-containing protein [Cantharellus anzutake]
MAPTKTNTKKSAGSGITLKRAARRVKMLSGGKPIRDKAGNIIKAAAFQKGEDETSPGRVQPDRRWFGNTRVISQTALEHFRESLTARKNDPYSVLLKRNKLPMSLLDDAEKSHAGKRVHIVDTEPFTDTFGKKAQRKKPRLDVGSFEELGATTATSNDPNTIVDAPGAGSSTSAALAAIAESHPVPQDDEIPDAPTHADFIEPIFSKGTSRRIFGELYKVIDSSDVVVHVLDARDPLGTKCDSVLEFIKKEKPHKHVVLILNKCDLIPTWATARWISYLTPKAPTLAFHASINHSFGKDKKQISVGFVGYPNVGKSSIINCLKRSKVCNVAPIPGETKGVVRVENLSSPSDFIPALLQRVRPVYLTRTYALPPNPSATDPDDDNTPWEADAFLEILARKSGRLLKGGEPDRETVSKMVLNDWIRGKIPYFVRPPENTSEETPVTPEATNRKEKTRIGVQQEVHKILLNSKFLPDDRGPGEEAENENEDVEPTENDDIDGEAGSQDEQDSKDEENTEDAEIDVVDDEKELNWDDVYGAVAGSANPQPEVPKQQSNASDKAADLSEDDDEEDDGKKRKVVKDPRMKTNKRKATNFYTTANVKNRNPARRGIKLGQDLPSRRK